MSTEKYQTIQSKTGISAMKPRVSVILAVYNGERYVTESIESILKQNYKSFEFIIVDDGSTDGTSEILQQYSNNPYVTILTNSSNKGLTVSLNFGISVAKGEYVARIDSDDISVPQRLGTQVKFLDSNPDTWLVGSWYKRIIGKEYRGDPYCPVSDKHFYRWSLAFYCPFMHSSVMFRKEKVEESIGLYDPRFVYAMDYDLWSRIAEVAEVDIIPEILAEYREHDLSMTQTMPDASSNEPIEISTRIFQHWIGINEKIELDSELVIALKRFWLSNYEISKEVSIDQIIDCIQCLLLEFCASDRISENEKSSVFDSVNSILLTSYLKYTIFHSNRYGVFKPKIAYFIYRKFGFTKPLKYFFTRISKRLR